MAKSGWVIEHGNVCPLCGQAFRADAAERGFVMHENPPLGPQIFGDQVLVQALLDNGDLSPDYLEYYDRTGLCPFQQGQRDP